MYLFAELAKRLPLTIVAQTVAESVHIFPMNKFFFVTSILCSLLCGWIKTYRMPAMCALPAKDVMSVIL